MIDTARRVEGRFTVDETESVEQPQPPRRPEPARPEPLGVRGQWSEPAARIRAQLGWGPRVGLDGTGPARAMTADRGSSAGAGEAGSRRAVRPLTVVLAALVVAVAFAGGALGYSLLAQPTLYGAETEFVLTARPELSDAAVDRATLTQVTIVESPSVLQPVAARTGITLPELRQAVSADMVDRTNIMRIVVSDQDAARAVTVAELIAARYSQVTAQAAEGETAQLQPRLLTPARGLDDPLQPQPWRALAAGTLLGLLAAAVAVVALWRPWQLTRPSPYWT